MRASPITAYHQDEDGQWVAELECGHHRHVRHDPPMQSRPWVLTEKGRAQHMGTPIPCWLCAREAADDSGGDAEIPPA